VNENSTSFGNSAFTLLGTDIVGCFLVVKPSAVPCGGLLHGTYVPCTSCVTNSFK